MTNIFSYPYKDFNNFNGNITISSGPVIFNSRKEILLHISSSTKKYQFIGGRLDIEKNLKENAEIRATEVIGDNKITFLEKDPLCIVGDIQRNGENEKLVLFHFKAELQDEVNIGEAEWISFEKLQELSQSDMLSSPNILIAYTYFLNI